MTNLLDIDYAVETTALTGSRNSTAVLDLIEWLTGDECHAEVPSESEEHAPS